MESPFAILEISEDASPTEVKDRWRELASIHHPDKGGDSDQFNYFRQAYTAALKIAATPKMCVDCNGTGKQIMQNGFSALKITCKSCMGNGERV